jgi:hypothetical protein
VVVAAGVAAAIDRPGTVRHAVRLIRKLLAITRVLMAYVISVKRTLRTWTSIIRIGVADGRLSTEIPQDDGRMFSVVERKKGNP